MRKQVFISKPKSELLEILPDLESFNLIAHSFLAFQGMTEEERDAWDEDADIIFFSSPRSVIFFFAQHPLFKGVKLACTGSATAAILNGMGHEVAFVGKNSGDMASVAEEFKTWCGDRKVLFPLSDRSLKTVSKAFPEDQKVEITVYKTIIESEKIPMCDIYVFTSPSNVEGFFLENKIPTKAHVVSWGKSTSKRLNEYNITPQYTLTDSTLNELIDHLRSV